MLNAGEDGNRMHSVVGAASHGYLSLAICFGQFGHRYWMHDARRTVAAAGGVAAARRARRSSQPLVGLAHGLGGARVSEPGAAYRLRDAGRDPCPNATRDLVQCAGGLSALARSSRSELRHN